MLKLRRLVAEMVGLASLWRLGPDSAVHILPFLVVGIKYILRNISQAGSVRSIIDVGPLATGVLGLVIGLIQEF